MSEMTNFLTSHSIYAAIPENSKVHIYHFV